MKFWEIVLATALGTGLFALSSWLAQRIYKRLQKWAKRKGLIPWIRALFSLKPWRAWPTPIKFLGNNNYIHASWNFSSQRRISLVPRVVAEHLLRERPFRRISWKEWYKDYKKRRVPKQRRKT